MHAYLIAVAVFLAGAMLGVGLAFLHARRERARRLRDLGVVHEPDGGARFRVHVEFDDGSACDVYRGAEGAKARDAFTASASYKSRRVTLHDGAHVRGFSDFGQTR
jgi:hypothetical protein